MAEINSNDIIEKYLLGLLSPEEQKSFEESLVTNRTLREEVEFQLLEMTGVKQIAACDLRSKFASWDREGIEIDLIEEKGKSRSTIKILFWLTGLLVLVMLIVLLWYLIYGRSLTLVQSNDKLRIQRLDSLVTQL